MAIKSTTRKATKSAASPKPTATAKPVKKTTKPEAPVASASTGKAKVAPAAPAPVKPVGTKSTPKPPAAVKPADGKRQVTFTYYAPEAATVLVAGDFTKWESSAIRLVKETGGQWKTTVALEPGKYLYRMLVDGHWQNDPGCSEVQANEFGSENCVLSVAA